MAMSLDDLVAAYIRLRDMLATEKAAYETKIQPWLDAQKQIESVFLAQMNEQGMDNFSTPHGTPYRSKRYSVSVTDWPVFYEWTRASDQEGMLVHGANKATVAAYAESTGQLPPGLKMDVAYTVNVRRK